MVKAAGIYNFQSGLKVQLVQVMVAPEFKPQ
jgi:hypothetical protein